ncbi:putative PurR-regulated permease PerM [Isoptericola sp. CG 20/1183]|uniref:PurR-regulated permease PerM n=1 Tax=Isoptericola halotolerans TaxID=300560 RepID=A0ABX5EHI9_9MICO|nr:MULTISPECIES: AI-2E family transporter [Isoptericola]PRZ06476.1 putative PurR-regulated permease PerM [Isoptericola halotolerans]PRZ06718.1 putative PurR-regulated permease PerM [Isoptericola sp. CG 20/1183]
MVNPEEASASGRDMVPASVRGAAAWSWRLLIIAAGVAGLVWLLSQLKTIVVPVAVALLISILLRPLRLTLERWGVPRGLATALSILGLIAFVTGLVVVAGQSIVNGFQDLWDQAVAGFEEFLTWLSEGPLGLDTATLSDLGNQAQDLVAEQSSSLITGALGAATTVGHVLVGIIIALFCTIFFLQDGRSIWTWVVNVLPMAAREKVHQAGRRGMVTLSSYVRTQILVALVDALGIGIGSAFFVPALAIPIGILVFIGSFVPILGAIVTGAIACAVVLVAEGWVAAAIMLGIVLLVQQAESHILQPFLMGHAVSLHPVAVVLVVAAGSLAAGLIGALFAVPLAAVLNTVMQYLHGHDKFPELGTADHLPLLRRRPSLADLPGTLLWPSRSGASQGDAGAAPTTPGADPAVPADDAGPAGESRT